MKHLKTILRCCTVAVVINAAQTFCNDTIPAKINAFGDDSFCVWFNGKNVGQGWGSMIGDYSVSIQPGKNVIALYIENAIKGGAGACVLTSSVGNIMTDTTWKCYLNKDQNWTDMNFNGPDSFVPGTQGQFSQNLAYQTTKCPGSNGTFCSFLASSRWLFTPATLYFRKKFTASAGPALIRFTSESNPGYTKVYVNGQFISASQNRMFNPGTSPSQTGDNASCTLVDGRNVIAVQVTDNNANNYSGMTFALDVIQNGAAVTMTSPDWKMYGKEMPDWTTPGFNDNSWTNAWRMYTWIDPLPNQPGAGYLRGYDDSHLSPGGYISYAGFNDPPAPECDWLWAKWSCLRKEFWLVNGKITFANPDPGTSVSHKAVSRSTDAAIMIKKNGFVIFVVKDASAINQAAVYDMKGDIVKRFAGKDFTFEHGAYRCSWHGANCAPGTFVFKVNHGNGVAVTTLQ